MSGGDRIEAAVRRGAAPGRPAIAAFVTAGYPSRARFEAALPAVAGAADVVEVGVPFSDPMADGVTIQRASREALAAGVTLRSILETLGRARGELRAPIVLMSYANPIYVYGPRRLAADARAAGVSGLIVPDLPLEEQGVFDGALDETGLAVIQLVTPASPLERLARLASATRGFLYAVASNGTTGGAVEAGPAASAYLARAKAASRVPVLAGFGIRTARGVAALVPPADGVVVGSGLIECLERGGDPVAFLEALRGRAHEREEAPR